MHVLKISGVLAHEIGPLLSLHNNPFLLIQVMKYIFR
jgi:hypothetical protein